MAAEATLLLALEHVSRRYPGADGTADVVVLSDVDLTVSAGESLAVVGPSGSGKTTLLSIIGGLDRPSAGRVLLQGRDLAALDDAELARVRNRAIGFIFQNHHLLPQCTALENVLVPTLVERRSEQERSAAVARARRLLERVGLAGRLAHRPGQLSGGERQRVAVVRALINAPKLLLADEPTGALDRAAADELGELLVELNREEGVTLILVTHSLGLAARMSRRLELTGGALVETGAGS
ncbi:MAG: ABC transporter ATP-binding protein [Phycisphaerae bacterium]|jgi:predicted ABC-type transport system involved in lysophospholipase L1 biosynthesis ATPase subunit